MARCRLRPFFLMAATAALAVLLALPLAVGAQTTATGGTVGGLTEALDAVLERVDSAGHPFNGVLLVGDASGELYTAVAGRANFELDVPVTRGRRFRIASLSKQFAGALAVLLEAEGVVDPGVPVSSYLPSLEGTPAGAATLRLLLDHRSGLEVGAADGYLWRHVINEYPWDWRANRSSDGFQPDTFVARMAVAEQATEPGAEWQYCNACYVTAGLAMVAAPGSESYEALLRERILDPLGMRRTALEKLDEFIDGRAYPYERANGAVYPITRFRNLAPLGPAGGMASTIDDMQRWAMALFHTDALLTAQQRRALLPAGRGYQSGLGFQQFQVGGEAVDVINHTGQIAGTFGWVAYLPSNGRHIVTLSNIGFTFPQQAFMNAVVAAVAGAPPGRQNPSSR